MWVIRLALTVIILAAVLLIGILVHAVTWIVGRFDPAAALRMRSGYIRLGLKAVWFVGGGKATIIGTENIPTDRPVLFVGNHRSMMDVVLAGSLIPFPVGFISKKELEKIPLLHMQMVDINCLFLDRKDDRQALKTILKTVEILREGDHSMGVFPEGYESKTGELLPFRNGAFKIAQKAQVPIVVAVLRNTKQIAKNMFRRRTDVDMEILGVVPVEELTGVPTKDVGDRIHKMMEQALEG